VRCAGDAPSIPQYISDPAVLLILWLVAAPQLAR
jgi:hypothetical protein